MLPQKLVQLAVNSTDGAVRVGVLPHCCSEGYYRRSDPPMYRVWELWLRLFVFPA